LETEKIEKYLFVDEVEFPQIGQRELSFYFLGIEIDADKIDEIENQLSSTLVAFKEKGFHARDVYKPEQNQDIMIMLNKIILDNKLKIFCFPFVKEWLKRIEFSTIKDYDFGSWVNFPRDNYRALSLFFFLHTLNYHLTVKENQKTLSRIIFDADWQNRNSILENGGEVFKTIGNVYFTKQNQAIVLALADHIAYLFISTNSKIRRKSNF